MISNFIWIFLLILQCGIVTPRSTLSHRERDDITHLQYDYDAQNKPKDELNEEQVISVRITSSVAVGRGRPRTYQKNNENISHGFKGTTNSPEFLDTSIVTKTNTGTVMTDIPPNLVGANIEYIRQLNAKKEEAKSQINLSQIHPSLLLVNNKTSTETESVIEELIKNSQKVDDDSEKNNFQVSSTNYQHPIQQFDSPAEPSIQTILGIGDKRPVYENIDHTPLSREMLQLPSNSQVNKLNEGGPNFSEIDSPAKNLQTVQNNETDDTIAASSIQSLSTVQNSNESYENIENVPLARSVPFAPSPKNYIQGLNNKSLSERGNNPSLTTVSFDIVHDTPKLTSDYNAQTNTYTNTNQGLDNTNKFYEPPKVYSQPSKIYSEPAKFYSEPAKVYSEPAKIYSEPAKIYSEPAKIYSEPAKFYSPPASLHLTPEVVPNYTPWQAPTTYTEIASTTSITPTIETVAPEVGDTQSMVQQPENNYEVDEKESVESDGRSDGVQETTTEKCKQDNCKVGYVVEGRQYKKYRVEERTPDGFIVGEYGVVRNEDGALRGVRYTADSDASPRLIYDALMKFLQL